MHDRIKTIVFTSGVLFKDGKILVLKRRDDEKVHPGKWDCVGGHMKEFESGEECILREAKEEIGVDVRILKRGKVFEINEKGRRCIVLPYLLDADITTDSGEESIKLTEHVEFRWVTADELKSLDCVPDLIEASRLFGLIE